MRIELAPFSIPARDDGLYTLLVRSHREKKWAVHTASTIGELFTYARGKTATFYKPDGNLVCDLYANDERSGSAA
jgi:hypothetical protein